MKKNIAIAFKYSCIYFIVYFIRSVYLMMTYEPGAGRFLNAAVNAETLIVFYSLIIAFSICLVLSHSSYIKQTAERSLKDILVLSFLFLFITYTMVYAAGYLEYHFFYKNQYSATNKSGLLALLDTFTNSGPAEPVFSPLQHLFWYPAKNLWDLLSQGRYWAFLHELIIAKPFMLFFVIYYEALYLLFKKYKQEKWFYILPVINKWKLIQIAQKPVWYFFVLFIPVARIIVLYSMHLKIAAHFKKNKLFALGMTLLAPFYYGAVAFNNEKPDKATET